MTLDYKPRMRMFAGPNGSGKSILKKNIATRLGSEVIGVYVNADEIEENIKNSGFLNLREFRIVTKEHEILNHFKKSYLLKKLDMLDEIKKLRFEDQKLHFSGIKINSYFSSVAADFIRTKLMKSSQSFSFETVMSHEDKVELIKRAKQSGYKTYLYFIATESPSINIRRIRDRVRQGGHDVPDDKVVSRYYKSLSLMYEAVKNSGRSYFFDSSEDGPMSWIAEARKGEIIYTADNLPEWFINYWVSKDY
jgi:predicted ABC-type ATPase